MVENYKKDTAFTLIELLVVIAVLGVIAAVFFVLVDPLGTQQKGRDSKQAADLNQDVVILSSYYVSKGEYPTTLTELETFNGRTLPIPPGSVSEVLGTSYGYFTNSGEARLWGYLEQHDAYLVFDSSCNTFVVTHNDPAGLGFDCGTEDVYPLSPGAVLPTATPVVPTPTPEPIVYYHVSGYIDVQGRANDSGVTVTFTGTPGTFTATTVSSAAWSIDVPTGDYTITADKPLYLLMQRTDTISADATLPTKTLYGGDATNDGTVNTDDTNLINPHFGETCSSPGWDPNADVNGDCNINIQDLALAGGNNGKVEPLVW